MNASSTERYIRYVSVMFGGCIRINSRYAKTGLPRGCAVKLTNPSSAAPQTVGATLVPNDFGDVAFGRGTGGTIIVVPIRGICAVLVKLTPPNSHIVGS